MAPLNSFKVFIAPFLDRNASKQAASTLGKDVKSEVTEATRNISLEIQTSMRKMGGAVSRGQVAGQAIFALLNRIVAQFDEMKSSINEASASLGAMNETAGEFDTTVERVARHELTLADAGLSVGQQQAYDNFLLQVQRVMDAGMIGSGENERTLTFESSDVLNNALELRKLLDAGIITLDDLGIAGKQQARLNNTFNALSTEKYEQTFNSSKFNGVNGLNQADQRNADLQNQHAVAMMLAEAERAIHVAGAGDQSMVARTLESERKSYQRMSESLNPEGYGKALEAQESMEKTVSLLTTTFNNLAVNILPPLTHALEFVLPPLTTALNFAVDAIGNLIEHVPSIKEIGNNLGFNAYEGRNINIYDNVTRNDKGLIAKGLNFLGLDHWNGIDDWGLADYSTEELAEWIAYYESRTWMQLLDIKKDNPRVEQGYEAMKQELARRQVDDLTDSSNVR